MLVKVYFNPNEHLAVFTSVSGIRNTTVDVLVSTFGQVVRCWDKSQHGGALQRIPISLIVAEIVKGSGK